MDIVYSVRHTHPDSGDRVLRLGPYFSMSSARNQASRAAGKGCTILGIDEAHVSWNELNFTDRVAAAVEELNQMGGRDAERMHSEADKLLLALVPLEVREAYERLVQRSPYWATA